VILAVRKARAVGELDSVRADIAASFQRAAVDTLVARTLRAAKSEQLERVIIAGGVGANKLLRTELAARFSGRVYYPRAELCTDNGAMIALAGAMRLADASRAGSIQATARWSLETLARPESNKA
jgi:N6-L-threonylcarbamoyladenine synthase